MTATTFDKRSVGTKNGSFCLSDRQCLYCEEFSVQVLSAVASKPQLIWPNVSKMMQAKACVIWRSTECRFQIEWWNDLEVFHSLRPLPIDGFRFSNKGKAIHSIALLTASLARRHMKIQSFSIGTISFKTILQTNTMGAHRLSGPICAEQRHCWIGPIVVAWIISVLSSYWAELKQRTRSVSALIQNRLSLRVSVVPQPSLCAFETSITCQMRVPKHRTKHRTPGGCNQHRRMFERINEPIYSID